MAIGSVLLIWRWFSWVNRQIAKALITVNYALLQRNIVSIWGLPERPPRGQLSRSVCADYLPELHPRGLGISSNLYKYRCEHVGNNLNRVVIRGGEFKYGVLGSLLGCVKEFSLPDGEQ